MKAKFVNDGSIVKKIWGKADTVLFIFAGAAAEFALNKAVDWLYFTGRLPADPLNRLFSTVVYAQQIIFSELEAAFTAIDKITAIHKAVESNRGLQIPDWAYRDVLFLLIYYSISSFELLERKLSTAEKQEIFDVFYRVGIRMELTGLPVNFAEWQLMREEHLKVNLACSEFTVDLFKQYKKHLGTLRYKILRQVQAILVPKKVAGLLRTKKIEIPWIVPVLYFYKVCRAARFENSIKNALLPLAYKEQIQALDISR